MSAACCGRPAVFRLGREPLFSGPLVCCSCWEAHMAARGQAIDPRAPPPPRRPPERVRLRVGEGLQVVTP